ncbi:MAG: fumarylacetoacetate hydrolase family protein [Planctomycetota bacterium]|jgi:acylpyruvate hydrolase
MKLLSFGPKGMERPGLLAGGDRVLDLSTALPEAPGSVRELLARGFLDKVAALGGQDPAHYHELSRVRLAAPVPEPSKILCLGLNYKDHAKEQNKPVPTRPLVFPKVPSAVIAHGEAILLPDPDFETFVDPEVELAFVISRRASRVSEAEALDYVAGYTIVNDVSGRDTQNAERQWLRAKGFDTFAPMGPWIVTKDELPDPHGLDITCKVNGEVRQKSNTSNLVFTVPFLVSYLSQTITLEPGDVIATGTPGGVGIFRDPPVHLEEGDNIVMEISKIGVLENSVARRK